MTLKEKFLPFVDWMDLQDDCTDRNWALRNANACEQIADEFAIEFTEWKDKFISEVGDWKQDGVYLKNSYTTKELLEIYKKEREV